MPDEIMPIPVSIKLVLDLANEGGAYAKLSRGGGGMCVALELLRELPSGAFSLLLFEPYFDQSVYYMHRLDVVRVYRSDEPGDDDRAFLDLDNGETVTLIWPADAAAWRAWTEYRTAHKEELDRIARAACESQA